MTAAATEEKEAEAAAAPKASSIPNLPGDALVMSSPGESTWLLEKKEFAAIESGGNEDTGPAPGSFAPVLQSFEMQGVYYHAFPNTGDALETADMPKLLLKDDGESPLPVRTATDHDDIHAPAPPLHTLHALHTLHTMHRINCIY